ncbi:carbonic anhydrase-like [Nematolebias whitei]|uniref:carbonic anhydrase-like n=1 Tax=Nematolebias whitei TaxID=451745 RepID=UPI00189B0740|nr:carbonic anhydrase-like [Nematolebias whitei]
MYLLLLARFLSLVSLVKCSNWCYTGCKETPSHWKDVSGSSCGGQHQSPIDIDTSSVKTDSMLNNFTFVNFSSQHAIKWITNNGHSVQCTLMDNEVEVSGGGLNGTYSAVQFHFHWGDKEYHPGSEHTVDGHRYQMEMHIVTLKKGVAAEEAKTQSEGFAVLGFFINATEDGDLSGPWHTLTSNLKNISESGGNVAVNFNFSINDLIRNVDRTKFYRHYGSLTTPDCKEAVVWTLFHEPIQVHKDLVYLFPMATNLMNNYRPVEPLNGRRVTASPETPLPPKYHWCYDSHCDYNPSLWYLLPDSHCNGKNQSPINIDTQQVMMTDALGSFQFKNFDDQSAIKYITNNGHTVKCVLQDNLVEVSGGGLNYVYSTLQFHFHWGTEASNSLGSEHTVDSQRYPMELHIVGKRKDLTLEEALQTSDGMAVLSFFIEASQMSKSSACSSVDSQPTTSSTSDMTPWKKLTNYLSAIQNISTKVEVTDKISIDDLLGSVNRDSYYRYSGSLTTPICKEAVVWTIFKETVKVDENLMIMFPKFTSLEDIYRPIQSVNGRKIYSTSAAGAPRSILLYPLSACLFALVCST